MDGKYAFQTETLEKLFGSVNPSDDVISKEIEKKLSEMNKTEDVYANLTEREKKVLECLIQGKVKNQQIAEVLGISESSVRRELPSLYNKLGYNSKEQAVWEALKVQEILLANMGKNTN
jgi:DNA-binding NarL/FixJ family response regulator